MPPRELQVLISQQNDTVTVTLAGEAHFDFDTSDAHVKSVLDRNPRMVVVETAQLSFITSIGMCFLINLRRHVREIGGTMRLQGLQPQVRKVMEHAHVIHLFDLPPEATRGAE